MDNKNENENEKNKYIDVKIDNSSKSSNLTLPSIKKKRRRNSSEFESEKIPEEDILIKKYINEILEKEHIQQNDLINLQINKTIMNSDTNPFDEKLFSYSLKKQNKTDIDYLFLIHCLKHYELFNNLIISIRNPEEKLFIFTEIINNIDIINKEEKSYVFKLGENSEKFYFLISGEVSSLIPKKYETMMNKCEFFVYMKFLYKIEEIELFNLNLKANAEIYDKLETLHYITGDKNMKLQLDAISQLKFLEKSYYLTKLNNLDNTQNITSTVSNKNVKSVPFSNKYMIQIPKNIKIEDILKTDNIVSSSKNNKQIPGTVEDYIENIMPIYVDEELRSIDLLPQKLVLYKYILDKKINKNDYIEDIKAHMIKRKSTIICNSDCLFCFFPKKEYFNAIKKAQTKFHKDEMLFLLNNEIFNNLTLKVFDKRYFHLFKLLHINQYNNILTQGEICDYIYFLKEGELCVSFNTNLNEIYRIIELKGGPKGRKEKDRNYLKRFYSAELDDLYYDITSKIKLFNINENYPIGLDDYIDETNNNISLFNAICLRDSEIFAIKREDFNFILSREGQVNMQKKNYVYIRNNVLIERLSSIKNHILQQITMKKYGTKINFSDLQYLSNSPNKDRKKYYKRDCLSTPKNKNKLPQKNVEINYKLIRNIASGVFEDNISKNFDNENQSISMESKKNSRISSSRISNGNKEPENKNILFNSNNQNQRYSAKFKNKEKKDIKNSNNNIGISGIDFNEFTFDKRTHEVIINSDAKSPGKIKIKNDNYKSENRKNRIKLNLDPLDKIYQNLKSSFLLGHVKKNVNLKEKLNIQLNNNKNNGYCITNCNDLSSISPSIFFSNNNKLLVPLRNKIINMNVKTEKNNRYNSINKNQGGRISVLLNIEKDAHSIYYGQNNRIISPIKCTKISRCNSNYNNKKISNSKNDSSDNLFPDEKLDGDDKIFKNDLLSVLNVKKKAKYNHNNNSNFVLPKINNAASNNKV